jgi:hypothetical protein
MKATAVITGNATVKFRGEFLFFRWNKTVNKDINETLVLGELSGTHLSRNIPIAGPASLTIGLDNTDTGLVGFAEVSFGGLTIYRQDFPVATKDKKGVLDLGAAKLESNPWVITVKDVRGVNLQTKITLKLD